MIGTLVVKDYALAHALRHHSNHPLATAIRDLLSDNGASIHPRKLPIVDDGKDKYFGIQVMASKLDALLLDLRRLPGVAGAYIQPKPSPA